MRTSSIEERVAVTVHERATRDVPYDLDLWPRISSRVQGHQSSSYPRTSRLPFRRPSLLVAAYLAVLVFAVVATFNLAPTLKPARQAEDPTAVAAGGTPQTRVTRLPSLTPDATATQYAMDYAASNQPYAYLDRNKYGKYLGVSRTDGDYTVTINWMYVDGNVMLIDLDLLGPVPPPEPDRRVTLHLSALSINGGPTLPSAVTRYSEKVEADKRSYLVQKDVANTLDQYGNQELDFSFTIAIDAYQMGSKSAPSPADATATWTTEDPENGRIQIAGPFNFQVRVPFIPARVARLLQTVTAGNIDVSLQQFRVTPSEVRSYIKVNSHGRDLSSPVWEVSAGAQVNGWDAFQFRTGKTPYGQMITTDLGMHTIYDNVYDEQGEWTFTISKLLNSQTNEVIEGPWIFKIMLPSATRAPGRWRVVPQSPIPTKRRPLPTPAPKP